MPSRQFRPTLFSEDDGLWRALSTLALVGSIALMSWLAQAKTEPRQYSARAWAPLPTGSSDLTYEDTRNLLKHQLLEEAEHGEIRPALLLETFIEQEVAHEGGDAEILMAEFLRRSAFDSETTQPIEHLAALKAQMLSGPDLVYAATAYTLTEVLLEDRLQCQSSTMTVALAWLQQEVTQRPGGPRPVLVASPNHVQPGLLYQGALHVLEGTSRGDRVAALTLAELGDVIIVDAADALTWTLLQEDTPDIITDRLLIYDNHGEPLRLGPGSGSDSWLHLPYPFGESISLSSTPRTLAQNSDPARKLRPKD